MITVYLLFSASIAEAVNVVVLVYYGKSAHLGLTTYRTVCGALALILTCRILGNRRLSKGMLRYIGLFTANAFMPMLILVHRPLLGEFMNRISLPDDHHISIRYTVIFYGSSMSSYYVVRACTLRNLFFHIRDNVQCSCMCCVMLTNKCQCGFITVRLPSPLARTVVVTKRINVRIGVAVITIITVVEGIAVSRTGRGNYGICVNVLEFSICFGIFLVAIIAFVLGIAVFNARCLLGIYNVPSVTCCTKLCSVVMIAVLTVITNISVLCASCLLGYRYIIVSVSLYEVLNAFFMTTNANAKVVAVLSTATLNVLL